MKNVKLIEFSGPFNAGKFTYIGRTKEGLSVRGYTVHSIQEDRSDPGGFIDRKNYLGREMSVLNRTLDAIIHVLDSSKADFVLIHRGLWDAMAFFWGLIAAGLVSEDDARPGIQLAEAWIKWIDLVILIGVPVGVSLQRGSLPGAAPDLIRDENSLKALFDAYEAFKKRLPQNSLFIDGSFHFKTKSFEKNLDIILEAILSLDNFRNCEVASRFISVDS